MEITVTRLDDGGYKVTLNERTITLPAGSKRRQKNNLVRFGTLGMYIEVDAGPYEFSLVTNGEKEVIVAQDKAFDVEELDRRGELYAMLEEAWREASEDKEEDPKGPEGGRKLRLKKQTRRAKRNTRNNKRRQLRKLTTRRR